MAGMKDLESRVRKIEDRNRKVESDKSWETSLTKREKATLVAFQPSTGSCSWLSPTLRWASTWLP